MRMNDADRQTIKATPGKIVNLQLFVNVFFHYFLYKYNSNLDIFNDFMKRIDFDVHYL